MTEEILYVLTQMKNGIFNEYETASIIDEMFRTAQKEKNRNGQESLPWDDDGKIRITVFNGHTLVDSKEAYGEYGISVDLGDAHIEIAECCGDIKCEDVFGDVKCAGNIECADIFGNVTCGGCIECESISGDVTCGGDIIYSGDEDDDRN